MAKQNVRPRQLTLVNQAAGVINANASGGIVINTGAGTFTNAGTLSANGGNILVSSAITGAGTEVINGANSIEDAAARQFRTWSVSEANPAPRNAINRVRIRMVLHYQPKRETQTYA